MPVCPTKAYGKARETLESFYQGRREFVRIPPSLKEFPELLDDFGNLELRRRGW